MPIFEIETPEGSFEVDAPDEQTALRALQGGGQEHPPSTQYQQGMQELGALSHDPLQRMAREQYDALPSWQKPMVAASDTLGLVANGATFGFGDKAVAAARAPFTGKSYADELAAARGQTQGARNRAGGAGTAAEITGAVAAPLTLAGKGVTLGGRLGTGAMTGAKGLAARTGLMAAEGAGYGALSAAGNDTDLATGAGIGALAGGVGNLAGEAISAGVSKIAGKFNPKVPTPSVEDFKDAGRAAFDRADKAGVIFNKQAIQQLQRNIVTDLTDVAFHPQNEPGAVAALKTLQSIAQGNVTMKGLHAVRRMAQNGFIVGNNSNNAAIGKIIARIDELIDAGNPAAVLMGNSQAAAQAFNEAKKHWHIAKKLETVERAVTKGEQNAAAYVSADPGRQTMRQLKNLLQSEAKTRGFSKEEMKQLAIAAGYSPGQRVAHAVGGLLPRGRLLASIHGAAALGSGGASIPLQAAGAAVGFAAQKTADVLARKSILELTRLIANGGVPPAQVQNVVQRLAHSKREALTRALMALGVNLGVAQQPAQQ